MEEIMSLTLGKTSNRSSFVLVLKLDKHSTQKKRFKQPLKLPIVVN